MSASRQKLIESGWWEASQPGDPTTDYAAFQKLKQRVSDEGREDEYLRILCRLAQITPMDEFGSLKFTSIKKLLFKVDLQQQCEAVLKLKKLSLRIKPAKD